MSDDIKCPNCGTAIGPEHLDAYAMEVFPCSGCVAALYFATGNDVQVTTWDEVED